jgi:hypothetical protein
MWINIWPRTASGSSTRWVQGIFDRVDADPDQDPNFHFDTNPDPDWHQNDADLHADSSPSFTHVGYWGEKFT